MARKKSQEQLEEYLPGFAPTPSVLSDETPHGTADNRKKWRPQRVTVKEKSASWGVWKMLHVSDDESTIRLASGSLDALPSTATLSRDLAKRMAQAFPDIIRKHHSRT